MWNWKIDFIKLMSCGPSSLQWLKQLMSTMQNELCKSIMSGVWDCLPTIQSSTQVSVQCPKSNQSNALDFLALGFCTLTWVELSLTQKTLYNLIFRLLSNLDFKHNLIRSMSCFYAYVTFIIIFFSNAYSTMKSIFDLASMNLSVFKESKKKNAIFHFFFLLLKSKCKLDPLKLIVWTF